MNLASADAIVTRPAQSPARFRTIGRGGLNGGNIEASPAVYNNYVVVGHRSESIYGIEMN